MEAAFSLIGQSNIVTIIFMSLLFLVFLTGLFYKFWYFASKSEVKKDIKHIEEKHYLTYAHIKESLEKVDSKLDKLLILRN